MKNYLLITGFIFSISVSGCRISKETTEKTSSVVVESKSAISTKTEQDSSSKNDRSVIEEIVTRTTTTIKFSDPDSTGKQHPVEQKVEEEKTNRKTSANITEKKGKAIEEASATSENSKSKQDVKIEADEKKSVKIPKLLYLIVFLLLGFLVFRFRNVISKYIIKKCQIFRA